jgi:hypothetical protein
LPEFVSKYELEQGCIVGWLEKPNNIKAAHSQFFGNIMATEDKVGITYRHNNSSNVQLFIPKEGSGATLIIADNAINLTLAQLNALKAIFHKANVK